MISTSWDPTNPHVVEIFIQHTYKDPDGVLRWLQTRVDPTIPVGNYSSQLYSQWRYREFPVPQKCGGKATPKTLFIVNYVVNRALATSEEGEEYTTFDF
jgi:hypothetical protein